MNGNNIGFSPIDLKIRVSNSLTITGNKKRVKLISWISHLDISRLQIAIDVVYSMSFSPKKIRQ